MQDIVEASGRRKRWYPAALREIFAVLISSVYAGAYKRAMIIQRVRQKRFLIHHHPAVDEPQLSTKMSGGVRGMIENIKEVVIEITKRPLRVRLRSTQPVASNSQLHMLRKISSRTNSSLQQLLELLTFLVICSLIRARYVYPSLSLI
ncbi:hypothetical protein Tco_0500974 [Tanacetum coccineum]